MNSVKIIEVKTHDMKVLTLYLQIILTVLLAIFGVITLFFNEDMLTVVYFLLSGILFLMAWNNHKFYKHKYLTIIYMLFGILTLTSGIVELL